MAHRCLHSSTSSSLIGLCTNKGDFGCKKQGHFMLPSRVWGKLFVPARKGSQMRFGFGLVCLCLKFSKLCLSLFTWGWGVEGMRGLGGRSVPSQNHQVEVPSFPLNRPPSTSHGGPQAHRQVETDCCSGGLGGLPIPLAPVWERGLLQTQGFPPNPPQQGGTGWRPVEVPGRIVLLLPTLEFWGEGRELRHFHWSSPVITQLFLPHITFPLILLTMPGSSSRLTKPLSRRS